MIFTLNFYNQLSTNHITIGKVNADITVLSATNSLALLTSDLLPSVYFSAKSPSVVAVGRA